VSQVERKPEGIRNFQHVFLFSAVLILPGVQWPLFFWINGFVPLTAFVFLYIFGWNSGNKIVFQGAAVALVVCILLQTLPFYLIALVSVPSGYVIARCAARSEGQLLTGLKAILTLGICWLAFWGVLVAVNSAFSYTALIHSVQNWLDFLLKTYRHNETIPVDSLIVIEQMLTRTKTLFPVILPAVLSNFVLLTVWLTMVYGNRLALKFTGRAPWPEYKLWRLPDKLIWAEIFSAVLALVPLTPLANIGINLLILVSILFIFQGFSVVVFYFNKWNMPLFFRIPLYVLAVIQSTGTLIILIIGIADIWLDFRRLNQSA
jgi:uncharacterized protein YybS (DUF2232 family)